MKKYLDKIYKKGKSNFGQLVKENLINNQKMFIVTANPETIMTTSKDNEFSQLLLDNNTTIIPDGIGICKGIKILEKKSIERIPGVEIADFLLKKGNENHKKVYFFGATKEVLEDLIKIIKNKYPYLEITGYQNGYTDNKDQIFDEIVSLKPDIILVALGIPIQEKLIYKHLDKFDKGIFVGVGGSFDVLAGHKKRAPKIFIKLNLEWLYRIIKEPKRIKRFYNNNIKFIIEIKKLKGKNHE